MTSHHQHDADRLERYLDGLLTGGELARFEADLARDPALAAEVALQRRINDTLAQTHRAPVIPLPATASAAPGADAPITAASGLRRSLPGPRWAWYAAAAALTIAGVLVFERLNAPPAPTYVILTPDAVYEKLVADGFKPEFVCTTDEEFAEAVRRRLGSGLVVSAAPGLEILGWAYGDAYKGTPIGPDTLILMVRVDERPAIVLMDRVTYDPRLSLPDASPLHLFRREFGPLVLYEITPHERPRALDSARLVGP